MTGTITHATLATQRGPAGGMIRAAGIEDRVPFAASELVGMKISDASGREVSFDIIDGHAVRVRPIRGEHHA